MEIDDDVLCIGDLITLRNTHGEGWLCSEGVVSEECFVANTGENFENCLWEIYVQLQYSASRDYEDALYATQKRTIAIPAGLVISTKK